MAKQPPKENDLVFRVKKEESVEELKEEITLSEVADSNLSPELTQKILDSAISKFKESNPDKNWEDAEQDERYSFIEQARKG